MKRLLLSSLLAMLMLASCQNEAKKDNNDSTKIDSNISPPPAPVSDSNIVDSNSTAQVSQDTAVFDLTATDSPPKYPGGMERFYKLIGANLKYPKIAEEQKVQGSVLVSFTIEKDGTLTNVKVDKGLGFGLDEEAVRAIKKSEKWEAGMAKGKPVRVKYSIPVKFALG